MKRWSNNGEIENPKIDASLEEIWKVRKRHGLAISHEDSHGAFEVVMIDKRPRECARRHHEGREVTRG